MKVYISEIQCNGLPQNQIDIKDLSSFKGKVYECIINEPEFNYLIINGESELKNITHVLSLENKSYDYLHDKFNQMFAIWWVSDNYVYGDLIHGITSKLKVVLHNANADIQLRSIMSHYPIRTEIPQ